jgi:hypothetical protein
LSTFNSTEAYANPYKPAPIGSASAVSTELTFTRSKDLPSCLPAYLPAAQRRQSIELPFLHRPSHFRPPKPRIERGVSSVASFPTPNYTHQTAFTKSSSENAAESAQLARTPCIFSAATSCSPWYDPIRASDGWFTPQLIDLRGLRYNMHRVFCYTSLECAY